MVSLGVPSVTGDTIAGANQLLAESAGRHVR
jgi:hypothetical protein